ncbi:WD repeat-containing protein-like protein [Lophiostoma macrostomum CBS 122681]|uniref:WD repeat-containing protein-like protein n=1 Tax=Lophiostoma macrostomum CBS 122681 TaxID=1314788 RepID=A0A6A6TFQ7_9PLEO|nr:WD repeat-containing protein-like protein [Lophiostoma macrostomum CBS 122681]
MLSSSPPPAAFTAGSRKLKKPPPITPKRFTRFFTPRNSKNGSSRTLSLGSSGRQLQDITRSAINRCPNATRRTTPRKTVNFADVMVEQVVTPKASSRKRKTPYLSPESSPAQSSPSKRSRYVTPPPFTIMEDDPPAFEEPPVYQAPIRRIKISNRPARILQRSFGGASGVGRGLIRDHCTSWQDQTANFYSGSNDSHQLQQGAPPFCTASCNENSMIAVGDEDGWVHLLDADEDSDFTKAHVSFRAHSNAIMDVQFSSDDMLLATGSGDQTAQIVDARTQQCIHVLAKHKSSVKQVRFQPGDDKIVATSSRDGAVNIWDLRCKGGNTSVHSAWGPDAPYAGSIRTLAAAHADSAPSPSPTITTTKSRMSLGKSEAYSRRADISVTALSFLPTGRQHLLLTASDASTCVKLWDIRGRYSLRGPALPISTTRHPESHHRHRHFAINSLTLSGDAARLYALSKDNTVYAYSTSHLILGTAPELSHSRLGGQKFCSVGQEGLGPIYGFRHGNFHAGSFYVKASLRKAVGDQTELLAVGSTDGCPVLFPTDERLFKRESRRAVEEEDELPPLIAQRTSSRPCLSRSSSSTRFPSLLSDTIPIYENGTPLIRGHDAEVTSVSWTRNGTLVSVGDDCRVRHWKEGQQARELRLNGEAEGRRWGCGWAVTDAGFDDEDE